jgi:Zn-dependent M28 family amino/carboxypeptidase
VTLLGEEALRERVERLAAIERGSAGPGEREAAELIAAELRETGARVAVETERVHGTYWWPIGIPCAAAAAAGLSRSRAAAVVTGALAAASTAEDVRVGPRLLRRVLPQRDTTNVIAEFGDPAAKDVVLVTAHHDSAHAGLVFHPELARAPGRRFPKLYEKQKTTPPTMWGSVAGPALVALGAATGSRWTKRLGVALSAGYAAAMADIGLRAVTPGANDNATGVAALLSLAHRLADSPPARTRVILVSAGSEESFMEGMVRYAERHYAELPRERTKVICLDTVGSPKLLMLLGEGMLGIRDYSKPFHSFLMGCAGELGLDIYGDLRFRNATDGLVALKAGFEAAMIGSADEFRIPTNYHWPTDTADRVHYSTVADAARLCARAIERLDDGAPR